jgi:putative nucleotidyltransferase with HDIG domain
VATLAVLSSTIEARDPFARGHASRVAALAESLARRIGLDRKALLRLRLGALLHDIGKLAVPEAVLVKPGALTDAELALIRRHPAAGARMLQAFGIAHQAVPCVLYHHERWDGGGYPDALAGDRIPIAGRIVHVADVFDVLVHERPYRDSFTWEQAAAEIRAGTGTQFDPDVVRAFEELGPAGWAVG